MITRSTLTLFPSVFIVHLARQFFYSISYPYRSDVRNSFLLHCRLQKKTTFIILSLFLRQFPACLIRVNIFCKMEANRRKTVVFFFSCSVLFCFFKTLCTFFEYFPSLSILLESKWCSQGRLELSLTSS